MGDIIKTSVIIPVYNTSLYLEECIESVFNQTQKEIEVIAINDGSTDDSYDVLLKLQEKYPDLIILSQDNHGLGYTRNIGMRMARGKFIYFLDSDDYIMEETIEECYECATNNKLDIVLFDAFNFKNSAEREPILPNPDNRQDIIQEREEIFSGISFLEKYYLKSYEPSSCFIYCSLEFLKKNDVEFLSGVYFEDNEFYCKIMTLADRVMYIPQMFYQRRCRDNSITGTKFDLKKVRDHITVVNAISDLKSLNGGKGWHVIREINLNLLKYIIYMCYANHLYHRDIRLFGQIIKTWMKIIK